MDSRILGPITMDYAVWDPWLPGFLDPGSRDPLHAVSDGGSGVPRFPGSRVPIIGSGVVG